MPTHKPSPLSLALDEFARCYRVPLTNRTALSIRECYQEIKQAWRTISAIDPECAAALKVDLDTYRKACQEAIKCAPEPCARTASEIFGKVAVLSATHMVIQAVKHSAPADEPLVQILDGAEQVVQDCMHNQGANAKQVLDSVQALYTTFFLNVPPSFVEVLE